MPPGHLGRADASGASGGAACAPGAIYLERTIPPAYRWARFGTDELTERVPHASIALAEASRAEPRVCLMGISRAGKTSLGVAMIREWVLRARRPAAFVQTNGFHSTIMRSNGAMRARKLATVVCGPPPSAAIRRFIAART